MRKRDIISIEYYDLTDEVNLVRILTQKEIVEKDFKTKFRGYSPKEVDEFLDLVIQDYKSFQDELEELKEQVEYLVEELDESSKQSELRAQSQNTSQSSVTNFDILKRLSNLERHVFGSKLEDTDNEE